MERFLPGDTVRQKSGGPEMKVWDVTGRTVLCWWMDGTKRKQDRFEDVALTKQRQ